VIGPVERALEAGDWLPLQVGTDREFRNAADGQLVVGVLTVTAADT
jgi:hypothetical protein